MFVQINNFDAHQPGLHKRTAPHFPEPPGSSRESSEIPSEEKGIEQKGTSISPTAKDVVDLWNEVVTSPIPKITKLTTDRETKINARLQSYPDLNTWRTVIVWINGQEWCRAAGRGDHPNWTATLDWLVRNDGNVQRQLERASVMPSKPAPGQATRDEAHLRYDRPFGATS
jgi:hypothetical protein